MGPGVTHDTAGAQRSREACFSREARRPAPKSKQEEALSPVALGCSEEKLPNCALVPSGPSGAHFATAFGPSLPFSWRKYQRIMDQRTKIQVLIFDIYLQVTFWGYKLQFLIKKDPWIFACGVE